MSESKDRINDLKKEIEESGSTPNIYSFLSDLAFYIFLFAIVFLGFYFR